MMLLGKMDYNYSDYDSSSLYSDESVNTFVLSFSNIICNRFFFLVMVEIDDA